MSRSVPKPSRARPLGAPLACFAFLTSCRAILGIGDPELVDASIDVSARDGTTHDGGHDVDHPDSSSDASADAVRDARSGDTRTDTPDAPDGGRAAVQDAAFDSLAFCNPAGVAAASSLTDDFSSLDADSSHWHVQDTCVVEVDGGLVVYPDTVSSYCALYSNGMYHVTCSAITVKVTQVPVQAIGVQTGIVLNPPHTGADGGTMAVGIALEAGQFHFSLGTAAQPPLGHYDPVADLWWRLRESAGELYFETSPDATNWTLVGSIATPQVIDDVQIAIGADQYQETAPDAGSATFRCFNLPTGCE